MCGTMDDAGVECEGKVLLLFQKSLLLSSSDIIFDFKIGVIDMRNEWSRVEQLMYLDLCKHLKIFY
jgi:hypothetical protein